MQSSALPDYACVILLVAEGGFLVEKRPPDAKNAAGQWTCFGGKREAGEGAEECARRELREELGWAPGELRTGVDLFVGGRYIAHFFVAELAVAEGALRLEAGRAMGVVREEELDGAPLSSWHRAVFKAYLRREEAVWI